MLALQIGLRSFKFVLEQFIGIGARALVEGAVSYGFFPALRVLEIPIVTSSLLFGTLAEALNTFNS